MSKAACADDCSHNGMALHASSEPCPLWLFME